jgi:hypothetical protein
MLPSEIPGPGQGMSSGVGGPRRAGGDKWAEQRRGGLGISCRTSSALAVYSLFMLSALLDAKSMSPV